MIKWGKLVLAGLAASVVRYAINSVFGLTFQGLYDPVSGLWRAMMTPSWIQNTVLMNIIVAFLAVFAYAVVNTGLGKKTEKTKKGLKFGLVMFLIRDVSLSLMSFVYMPLSIAIVAIWLLSGLMISIANGLIAAHIYK